MKKYASYIGFGILGLLLAGPLGLAIGILGVLVFDLKKSISK
jgi:hypothetical protein